MTQFHWVACNNKSTSNWRKCCFPHQFHWVVWSNTSKSNWRKCCFSHHRTVLYNWRVCLGADLWGSYEHIRNFVDVCVPFSFKRISQKLVHLRLFPFSLMGEASKWFTEFPRDSITSWVKLTTAFQVQLFPLIEDDDSYPSFQMLRRWANSWDMIEVYEIGTAMSNSWNAQ